MLYIKVSLYGSVLYAKSSRPKAESEEACAALVKRDMPTANGATVSVGEGLGCESVSWPVNVFHVFAYFLIVGLLFWIFLCDSCLYQLAVCDAMQERACRASPSLA